MAHPVRVQERLRRWRHRGRVFDGRPREDSRALLTWGRTRRSSRRGGVLSPHASTALGMLVQWPGWRCDGGDGRTGPMVTEVTAPTVLTSRRSPVRAWSSRSSSLRALCRPFLRLRRVGCTGVSGIVPRGCCWLCRTASHSGGDGLAGGVGGAVPGCDSQARRGMVSSLTRAPANVGALNPPVGGAGMEAVCP
jgi:hypothetical protein